MSENANVANVFKVIPMALACKIFTGPLRRARGLLGSSIESMEDSLVLLAPCFSVHTFGMKYPLDLAFVDCEGIVRLSLRSVPAAKFKSHLACAAVIERPASPDSPWPKTGDRLTLAFVPSSERGANSERAANLDASFDINPDVNLNASLGTSFDSFGAQHAYPQKLSLACGGTEPRCTQSKNSSLVRYPANQPCSPNN